MRRVKVLLVSGDPRARELMGLAVAGIERRLGTDLEFIEAPNGEVGVRVAWRRSPDAIVADEIASRMGAFAMARDLRGAETPYGGAIVILLDRKQDVWLAEWAGADAWFVKPVDPFELADTLLELVSAKEPA